MTGPRDVVTGGHRVRLTARFDGATVSGRALDVEVHVQGELAGWAPAWDELVAAAPVPSPFLRSWWLANTATGRPRFVLVTEGDRLLGGMALEEDRSYGMQRLRMLGQGRLAPDHLDVLAVAEERDRVGEALARWCARPGTRLFDLDGLTEGNAFLGLLPAARAETVDRSPFRRLPAHPEEVLPSLPGALRNTIRRARRKLAAAGVEHRVLGPEGLDGGLERLRDLHLQRWGDRSGFIGRFERFASAARAGATAGEVVLHELHRDDAVVASQVDLVTAGRVSYFQAGRDMRSDLPSLGSVMMAHAVEHACTIGAREYDLLRGGQPYKDAWADDWRPVLRVLAAHGPGARAALEARRGRRAIASARRRLPPAARTIGAGLRPAATSATPRVARRSAPAASVETAARRAFRRPGESVDTGDGRSVRVLDDPRALESLRAAWEMLDGDVLGAPSSTIDWVAAFAAHLPPRARLRVLTLQRDGQLTGAIPLVLRHGRLELVILSASGLRYRDEHELRTLLAALLGLRRPVSLDLLPAGSPTDRLVSDASTRAWLTRTSDRLAGPSVPLDATWADPLSKLSGRRAKGHRRHLRRAEEWFGPTRFELRTPRDEVELRRWFDAYVELEARGWKGEHGIAFAKDAARREMYWRYLRSPHVLPRLVVGALHLGDHVAAMTIDSVGCGRYWGEKASYDPAFAKVSPGELLLVETLRYAADAGLATFEFSGSCEGYKRVWGDGLPLRSHRLYPANPIGVAAVAVDAAGMLRRRSARSVRSLSAAVRRAADATGAAA